MSKHQSWARRVRFGFATAVLVLGFTRPAAAGVPSVLVHDCPSGLYDAEWLQRAPADEVRLECHENLLTITVLKGGARASESMALADPVSDENRAGLQQHIQELAQRVNEPVLAPLAGADQARQRRTGVGLLTTGVLSFAVGVVGWGLLGRALTVHGDAGYIEGMSIGVGMTGFGVLFTTLGAVYYQRAASPKKTARLHLRGLSGTF